MIFARLSLCGIFLSIALVLLISKGLLEEKFVYFDCVGVVEMSEGGSGCLAIPATTLRSGDDLAHKHDRQYPAHLPPHGQPGTDL